ncbi:MAG: CcoQ/FixQ family Cbb3-type cytochrome c oxidase assembly chaperone [Flavobacteriales bacterium]|nr:CcoQ/FixQ family Cbb3-type cytochrome c oxidase assembly chaperone [Flavobacteriales bacterium]MCB9198288.1 CcoQ/FixQ family Cbb3-type cytochrome c oxidase assembly chaperone [Flavobacteriales bacterium]
MLKFIKHHLSSIDGIEIYPLISFGIFFLFFILLFFYVFGGGKNRFKEVSLLPLNDPNDQLEPESENP